jgi:hypothetical protein
MLDSRAFVQSSFGQILVCGTGLSQNIAMSTSGMEEMPIP